MKRRTLYGWFDAPSGHFLVSREPPDAPVRPAWRYHSAEQAREFAERKRATLLWIPELPA